MGKAVTIAPAFIMGVADIVWSDPVPQGLEIGDQPGFIFDGSQTSGRTGDKNRLRSRF